MPKRQSKKDERKLHIARVANELFKEKGFSEVSVNEIAIAADVSRRTVFAHFPRKELMLFPNAGAMKEEFLARTLDLVDEIGLPDALLVATRLIAKRIESMQEQILHRVTILKDNYSLEAFHTYFYHHIAAELAAMPVLSGGPTHRLMALSTWGGIMGSICTLMWAWQIETLAHTPSEIVDATIANFRPQLEALDKVRTRG